MGYTHYFSQKRDITVPEWKKLVTAVGALIKSARNVPVQFEYDESNPPLLDDSTIRFNGVGDDGHETFMLEREGSGDFCKTARKPYDLLVTASLLAAQCITKSAWTVTSDGGPEDWADAKLGVEQELGIKVNNELDDIFKDEDY